MAMTGTNVSKGRYFFTFFSLLYSDRILKKKERNHGGRFLYFYPCFHRCHSIYFVFNTHILVFHPIFNVKLVMIITVLTSAWKRTGAPML